MGGKSKLIEDALSLVAKQISDKAEFLDWFGGSKAVHPSGLPRGYVHATQSPNIEKFNKSNSGIWFSPINDTLEADMVSTIDHAGKGYVLPKSDENLGNYAVDSTYYPAFLSIKNPATDEKTLEKFYNGEIDVNDLLKMGHDGLIWDDGVAVVANPNQIKSPFNEGKFSANDDRIAKGPGGFLDDVVRMAGKIVSGEGGEDAAKAGIRAYHASPHDFDKFEWSPRTSMTGEGAQSYGAGLYFAESPSVSGRGGTYDKQFTRKLQEIDRTGELGEKMGRVKIGGKPSTEYGIENDPGFIEAVKAGNVGKYARERLDRWHELSTDEKYPYRDYAAEKMRAWEKLLNDYSGGADVYYPMKARIYEANIAADPEKMMRWDEPLKDQPVEVMRGLGVLNAEDIAALQAEKRAVESKLQGGGWNDPIETQNPDEFWSKVNASVAKNSDDYSRLMKIERELLRAGKDIPDVTSGKFYKSSSERPENISLELRDRGVPGIQFWDGNSRGKSYLSQWRTDPLGGWTTDAFPSKGEATEYLNDVLRSAPALKGDERLSRVIQNPKATSNYVITNDKLISIIRKYGIAGASAMLGYNLMENLDPKQALAATMADKEYSDREGMAGGGKAVKEALRIAQEGIEALTRGSGKTPKEVLGGFANHNPRVPFEEWRYEFEPTTELLPTKEFDPSQFRPGDVMIPLVGDRTSTGRKITSVAGEKLETPALTEGGPDYMRGPSQQKDQSVWASDQGVITGLEKRINNALMASEAQGYKDPKIYGTYVAMSPQSGDFSTHTAETVMGMLPNAKIKRADIKEFDTVMREKFPDWPGLNSPKAADYVVNANAGEHRKTFLDVMDTAYWRDKGFPDVSLARYVTTTPELVTAPTEAAGYNIARITPGVKPDIITQPHRSYPTTMHGEYVGGLPPGLNRDDVFTQFSREYDKNPAEPRRYINAKRRSFTMNPSVFQVMNEPEIEALIRKTEALKRGYADGGEVDDDVNDALRIAKDVGGTTGENPQVFLTDAKGRQYDAQGNPIQPTQTQAQSNSAATDAAPTPEQVGRRAAEDPATFDAMMERYAVPDRDIADYEALQKEVAQQPLQVQQMTHVGAPPMRDIKVDMPLLGGERSVGQAPYNVANPMSGVAQTAYDLKTVPLYFTPWTAPIGAGLDVAEGVATGDPTTASLAVAFGPGGKMAKAAGIGAANYFIDPSEAEAGPARWFSKAMEVAREIPMNKMTGEQALAMLRKGTSPEELRWTGTDVFLQGKPTVTKDELVDYLNKNRLQLNEIKLGGEKPKQINYLDQVDKDILDRYEPQFKAAEQNHKKALDYFHSVFGSEAEESAWKGVQDAKRVETQLQMAAMQEMKDRVGIYRPSKYGPDSSYQGLYTPGGTGYRENLYQFPQRDIYTPYVEQMKKDFWKQTYDEFVNSGFDDARARKMADRFTENTVSSGMAKALGREEEFLRIYKQQKDSEKYAYKSGHWQDWPDVLFHTRTQELTYDPPGANRPYRVHNVDEAQSDLGQAARETGFYDPEEARKWEADMISARKARDDAMDNLGKEIERFDAKFVADNGPEPREGRIEWNNWHIARQDAMDADEGIRAVRQQMNEAINRYEEFDVNRAPVRGKYARKPFVTSTEGWTDRAIKHELDKALDSGSDYFSWTPGAAHAERYDLSKHIGKVEYNPDTGSFLAYDPKGKMVLNESVNDPSELEEYVGKELADKIKAEEDSRRASIYDAYSVEKDDEGMWQVYLYGEPMYEYGGTPVSFSSKGDARDYINELQANDFSENPVRIEGLDLRTGGEGMIGYYDKIYLKRVQEVLKKATGTKPEIEVIEVQTADGPRKQLSVKLTDEMREKARFSDFNNGGRVTGGNAYDNDKAVDSALALTREY